MTLLTTEELTYVPQQGMNTRDYVRVLFRQKDVIILTMIVVMALVCVGLVLKTPVYEASVKILITGQKQVEAPYYKALLGMNDIPENLTQSEIVKLNPVLERVVDTLHLNQKPIDYEKE